MKNIYLDRIQKGLNRINLNLLTNDKKLNDGLYLVKISSGQDIIIKKLSIIK